jgi:hypothetical protein
VFAVFLYLGVQTSYCAEISYGKWKVEVQENTGRFRIFFDGNALNAKDSPITSYATLKLDEKQYHLGDQIGVSRIENNENRITVVYQVSSQLLVELEVGFKESPLVYDAVGIQITYRIDSRLDLAAKLDFRFVLDTAVKEDQKQGYSFPEEPGKVIATELAKKKETVLFYPYFIKAMTSPSLLYLSAWHRITEEFRPNPKELLNFRDIRSGEWDPAVTYYYDMGEVRKALNEIRFFVGLWQKPNRDYPRVKLFYPEAVRRRGEKVSFPILVQNNGDFKIDFLKIIVSSLGLKNQIISSMNVLPVGEKKEIVVEGELKEKVDRLRGKIEAKLWMGETIYQQGFNLNMDVGREEAAPRGEIKKVEPEKKIIKKDTRKIREAVDRINLILYFINKGLETGMSREALNQLLREIHELEKQSTEKNSKD